MAGIGENVEHQAKVTDMKPSSRNSSGLSLSSDSLTNVSVAAHS